MRTDGKEEGKESKLVIGRRENKRGHKRTMREGEENDTVNK